MSKVIRFEQQYDMVQFTQDVDTLDLLELKKKYNVPASKIFAVCSRNNINTQRLESQRGVKKHLLPPKEELVRLLNKGKQHIATLYGVSIPTVTGWLEKHDVKLPAYHGIKVKLEVDLVLAELEKVGGITSRAYKALGVSEEALKRFCIREGISFITQKDLWQKQRNYVTEKKDWLLLENKTRSLVDLGNEIGCDHTFLRTMFLEWGEVVALHRGGRSKGELEVKQFVESLGVDCAAVMFDTPKGKREVDVVVASRGVGIEYCGEYWHSTVHKEVKYHYDKFMMCKANGLKLITIFEHEWNRKRALIESMLKVRLGMANRLFARKTNVCDVEGQVAKDFHDDNHISGHLRTASKHVGLYCDGVLVSCMSLVANRFKQVGWEIARLSTKQNTVIVGGADKMFKYLLNTIEGPIHTYADLRFGEGNVYLQLGFEKVAETPPGYFYWHGATETKHPRQKFQKHKLAEFFSDVDMNKTEEQIMLDNGYYKVCDCGHAKYVYQR